MIAKMQLGNDVNYTIQVNKLAVIINGPIPVKDFIEIEKFCRFKGFTILDPGLGSAYGDVTVITSEEGSKILRDQIDKSLESLSPEIRWIKGWDTGISSRTLYYFFHDKTIWKDGDVPHDADDFGRCYRLMKKFPEWNIHDAKNIPKWEKVINRWEELSSLYEDEKFSEVYAILSEK